MLLTSQKVGAQHIDTTGCYLRDPVAVAGCTMAVVSVDSASQCVRLVWHPSPDTTVAGYCICSGSPCLGLDTIWGAADTTYLCLEHNGGQMHTYCVFAIDSCLHSSAMTDPVSNIVAAVCYDRCSRDVAFSWNPYRNMPGGVDYYLVECVADGVTFYDTCSAGATAAEVRFPSSSVQARARVAAVGGGLFSWSNVVAFAFAAPDSCYTPPPPPPHFDTVSLIFPNVFTPALSDNSVFAPVFPAGKQVADYSIDIYNRMGLSVFHSTDPLQGWDGTCRGVLLPQGVYVYLVRYRKPDGQCHHTGTVLLLR